MESALHDSLLPAPIIMWLSTFFRRDLQAFSKILKQVRVQQCWGCTLSGSVRSFVQAEPFTPWP